MNVFYILYILIHIRTEMKRIKTNIDKMIKLIIYDILIIAVIE